MPTIGSGDFTFLTEDLKRQREIAQEALQEAKRIDELIAKSENAALKEELSKAKEKLLNIARNLAANATHTSSMATITISGVGRK